jgi:hypothetical protein
MQIECPVMGLSSDIIFLLNLALKEHFNTAQGNALGIGIKTHKAL